VSAAHARGVRVLVLCAEIGAGHVTVARALVSELRERDEVEAVELRTDLEVMGRRLGRFLANGFDVHLERVGWTYELAYRVFFEHAAPRRAAQLALAALSGRALRRTVGGFAPDVVVTEFPVLSAALGVLRSLGRLAVPICSSISDPAGLYYWAHPGIDLHLLSWPEAASEVDRIAGPGRAAVVQPLIDRRFMTSVSPASARSALYLPDRVPVVLVSGGGWGMGDLAGATEVALATGPNTLVLCLTGHNQGTRERLRSIYGSHPRVRVLGFSDQMPTLMAAASALVHTTGGTTALEARVVGCPLINYGTAVAHVRAHAIALAQRGLAQWAPDRATLASALARTLSHARPAPLAVDRFPHAASLVLAVARGAGPATAERARDRGAVHVGR
jgi:UDP-N-acetylglucosamine:LPS N-acetylglucosamine transferase